MLRPQPALLPCQQLHCVREERAAAESGRASGRAAARAPGACEAAPAAALRPHPQLCPRAARRARRPAAAPVAPPAAVAGRGLVGTGVPARGLWHPGETERRGARGGRQWLCRARSRNCVGRRAVGLGAPRGQGALTPPGGAPVPGSAPSERAPQPHRVSRKFPCAPHFYTNFSDALARGGRGERGAARRAPASPDPSHADLLPLVASVATSPGRAGHGTRGERGNPRSLSEGSRAPRGIWAG